MSGENGGNLPQQNLEQQQNPYEIPGIQNMAQNMPMEMPNFYPGNGIPAGAMPPMSGIPPNLGFPPVGPPFPGQQAPGLDGK